MRMQERDAIDRLIDVSGLEHAPIEFSDHSFSPPELGDADELDDPDFHADDYEAELRRARLWH